MSAKEIPTLLYAKDWPVLVREREQTDAFRSNRLMNGDFRPRKYAVIRPGIYRKADRKTIHIGHFYD